MTQESPARRESTDGQDASKAARPGALLAMLEEAQAASPGAWLSPEALLGIARALGVPPARVYALATFYPELNLEPRGAHSITVCRGTACHTKGSLALLRRVVRDLGLGRITESNDHPVTDVAGWITVRTVACFGQCALAPVIQIDGVTHSRVSLARLTLLIQALERERGA